MLFGSATDGIKDSQKQHAWKENTSAVNSVGVDNQSPAGVEIFNLFILDICPL